MHCWGRGLTDYRNRTTLLAGFMETLFADEAMLTEGHTSRQELDQHQTQPLEPAEAGLTTENPSFKAFPDQQTAAGGQHGPEHASGPGAGPAGYWVLGGHSGLSQSRKGC